MSRTLTRNNVLVFTETLQSAAAATGNGTAFECLGFGALVAQVTGTFSGTVTFEGTVDGTNYIAIRGMNKNTGTSASTATAAGIFQFSVAGLKYFRARVSAYSSGSITVTATISPESEPALPAASTTAATVAIDQTTSGTTNKVVSTGAAAHDAAASGNPVQVGGVYRLADPALTDGDAGSIRLNAKGEQMVQSRELWTPSSIISTAAGSNKSITVPASKEYKLQHISLDVITTATVGNRIIQLSFDTGVGTNLIDKAPIVPTIAASLTRRVRFGLGYAKEATFDTYGYLLMPLPEITLQSGNQILMQDVASIDASNDTIKYYVRVLERSV